MTGKGHLIRGHYNAKQLYAWKRTSKYIKQNLMALNSSNKVGDFNIPLNNW